MLSEYISLEIDLEILDMLISDAAAGDEFWSAVNNRTISAGDSADDFGNAGFYNTQGQWFQTLGTKMQKLSIYGSISNSCYYYRVYPRIR